MGTKSEDLAGDLSDDLGLGQFSEAIGKNGIGSEHAEPF
jgi:hypothetical protein